MEPTPGAPSDNTTAVAVLADLREQGYDADLRVDEGGVLRCRRCDHAQQPEDVRVDVFRRLEGASEPDEMSAVLAVTCPNCGARGTAMVAFGPNASVDEGEFLRRVETPEDGGSTGRA